MILIRWCDLEYFYFLDLNRVVVWNKIITNKRQYWNILENFNKIWIFIKIL